MLRLITLVFVVTVAGCTTTARDDTGGLPLCNPAMTLPDLPLCTTDAECGGGYASCRYVFSRDFNDAPPRRCTTDSECWDHEVCSFDECVLPACSAGEMHPEGDVHLECDPATGSWNRRRCLDDSDCDCGGCVNGACYGGPGQCWQGG